MEFFKMSILRRAVALEKYDNILNFSTFDKEYISLEAESNTLSDILDKTINIKNSSINNISIEAFSII